MKRLSDSDWKNIYKYLQEMKPEFGTKLFEEIHKNFYPDKSRLIMPADLDDCIIVEENSEIFRVPAGLYFFDEQGRTYYYESFIDENTAHTFFEWKKLKKEDRQKLFYSDSFRKKLMKKDRESVQEMNPETQEISPELAKNIFSEPIRCNYFEEKIRLEDLFGCSEELEKKQEHEEQRSTNQRIIHTTKMVLLLENYLPHLDFNIRNEHPSKVKREQLNELLDEIASQYKLKHNRAKYVREEEMIQTKNGGMFKGVKTVTYKKNYFNHVFKPVYEAF